MSTSLKNYVADNIWVLRRVKDDFPLAVSYSPEGLIWASNRSRKALFFRNASISNGRIVGDLSPSLHVYPEKFRAKDHKDLKIHNAELKMLSKALKMLY